MNDRHDRYLDHRHPRNVHPNPGANHRSRHRFYSNRCKSRGRNPDVRSLSGDLGFHSRSIRLQPRQLALFAGRHNIETFNACFGGACDPGLHLCHCRGERAGRGFCPCRQQPRLGQKLACVSGGLRQYGCRALLDTVCDRVRPLQAAIVIAGVQSGRQDCRDQPPPCLCHFHCLNPLWLIDEGPQNPLAREDTESRGKSSRLRVEFHSTGRNTYAFRRLPPVLRSPRLARSSVL